MDNDKARQQLLAARAAIGRCARAFSGEPEWQELHDDFELFTLKVDQILESRGWGIRWPK